MLVPPGSQLMVNFTVTVACGAACRYVHVDGPLFRALQLHELCALAQVLEFLVAERRMQRYAARGKDRDFDERLHGVGAPGCVLIVAQSYSAGADSGIALL
jgi:hypothetical protein